MSYVGFGAAKPDCAFLQAMVPGTNTYMPGEICPAPVSKTGDEPPRQTWCGGIYTYAVQQGLINGGVIAGPVTGRPSTTFLAAVAAIAAKYNVPWDGDLWTVSPELCRALATEISDRAPKCPTDWPTNPCVVPIRNRLQPLVAPSPGPSPSPTPTPPAPAPSGSASRFVSAAQAPRAVSTAIPQQYTTQPQRAFPLSPDQQWMPTDVSVPPEQPPVTTPTGGIPTWAYVAIGAVAFGAVAYVATR